METPEGGAFVERELPAAQAKGETTAVASDRPDWLPEKFQDPEALAQAYRELEARQGSATTEPANPAQITLAK